MAGVIPAVTGDSLATHGSIDAGYYAQNSIYDASIEVEVAG